MNATRSNDSEDAAPICGCAWGEHAVAALRDPDSHRQLIDALVRRQFEAARRHVLSDIDDTPEADAKVALAIDEQQASGGPAPGATQHPNDCGAPAAIQS